MTVIDNTRTSIPADFRFGGQSLTTKLFAGLLTWKDRRTTRKALMQLTTRELDDIGLCRADIAKF